ncbi:hypothetical protein DFH06DRAFT_1314103 [Mycena polygramma]|nr:hypothetical protein DFH06DRAFT_1314103 [Mycena polygramma]
MHPSPLRRQLGGLVPPKIATPGLVSGNSGLRRRSGIARRILSQAPQAAHARMVGVKAQFLTPRPAPCSRSSATSSLSDTPWIISCISNNAH